MLQISHCHIDPVILSEGNLGEEKSLVDNNSMGHIIQAGLYLPIQNSRFSTQVALWRAWTVQKHWHWSYKLHGGDIARFQKSLISQFKKISHIGQKIGHWCATSWQDYTRHFGPVYNTLLYLCMVPTHIWIYNQPWVPHQLSSLLWDNVLPRVLFNWGLSCKDRKLCQTTNVSASNSWWPRILFWWRLLARMHHNLPWALTQLLQTMSWVTIGCGSRVEPRL